MFAIMLTGFMRVLATLRSGVNIDAPYGVSLTKEQTVEQASEIAEQLRMNSHFAISRQPQHTKMQHLAIGVGHACSCVRSTGAQQHMRQRRDPLA